jgi:hypothetical protein
MSLERPLSISIYVTSFDEICPQDQRSLRFRARRETISGIPALLLHLADVLSLTIRFLSLLSTFRMAVSTTSIAPGHLESKNSCATPLGFSEKQSWEFLCLPLPSAAVSKAQPQELRLHLALRVLGKSYILSINQLHITSH